MTAGEPVVCDAQVHAPELPPGLPSAVHVNGMAPDALRTEMAAAGVDRCVLVPLAVGGPDTTAHNAAALALAAAEPERYAVMGRFDLTRPDGLELLPGWRSVPHMLGMRLSFVRGPHLALLQERALGPFLRAAEAAGIPLMVLVNQDMVTEVGRLAVDHPELRFTIDHLGLTPYEIYPDLAPVLGPLLALAALPNVAVKASALPASVPDTFPFRSVHEPLLRVVEAFGARRVFWGSDLTRLKCPYGECVRLFTEVLALSPAEREWVLGRGVMEWIGWSAPREASGA